MMTSVAVIGEGKTTPETYDLARKVGYELARRGVTVVCGGMGGVMEGACRGAKEAGGTTVCILPGNSRRDANRYVDIPVVTGLGEGRNVIVVKSAQAVIAIRGRYGTLSEIAFALLQNIPVIGLETWTLQQAGEIDPAIVPAESAEEAVDLALTLAKEN
jgi:hypothetical protein